MNKGYRSHWEPVRARQSEIWDVEGKGRDRGDEDDEELSELGAEIIAHWPDRHRRGSCYRPGMVASF